MAHSNGKITAPVSFSDVQSVIGNSSTDLATLCKASTINMWAKYKPVSFSKVDTTPALNNKQWNPNAAVSNQWWLGDNKNFGLDFSAAKVDIPRPTTEGARLMIAALTTIATKIDGNLNGWTYAKPSGGSGSPYRLLDFLQYRHNAEIPIKSLKTENVNASSVTEYTVSVEMIRSAMVDITTRDYIMPEDIASTNLYIGIAIFKKVNNAYTPIAWATNTVNWIGAGINKSNEQDGIISDPDVTPSYIITKLKDGQTYYALPFYSTRILEQPEPNQSYCSEGSKSVTVITAPYTNFVSFTASQRGTSQNVAVPTLSNRAISLDWTYETELVLDSTPEGYMGGTVHNLTLSIVNELFDGTDYRQGSYAGDSPYLFGNVSVGYNERKVVARIPSSGTIYLDPSHSWSVMVWANSESNRYRLLTPIRP